MIDSFADYFFAFASYNDKYGLAYWNYFDAIFVLNYFYIQGMTIWSQNFCLENKIFNYLGVGPTYYYWSLPEKANIDVIDHGFLHSSHIPVKWKPHCHEYKNVNSVPGCPDSSPADDYSEALISMYFHFVKCVKQR